ncbi:unnamed protein product [Cladocopium goreaui]|uniref:Kinesin light chain n=1 Tax=Cladocopium goreaui TaxID=2562237 RepID=A0A9P1DQ89_9DINO|nr:unnamed protein product [Cladocopium goreaui]
MAEMADCKEEQLGSKLSEARQRTRALRQELASELQVAVELQGRLAKVRAEVETTRQLIDHELRESAAAKAKLLEVRRKRRDFEKRQHVELRAPVTSESGSGRLQGIPEHKSRQEIQEGDRATLLARAQRMLHHRGGADLEAAGANTASLTEARDAAKIVERLEDLGHEDDELYRALLQLSLQGLERHLDLEAPEVLARVHSLAVSLENLGERRDAAAFYRRAYEGRRKGLGDEHRDTLDSGLNLASCQRSLGEDAEALELFKNLLEGCQRALGHQNPVTLETAEQLAELLAESDELIAAWKLRRQLLEWYRAAYGEDDPMALSAMSKLAVVLASAAARGCAAPAAAADARARAARRGGGAGPGVA